MAMQLLDFCKHKLRQNIWIIRQPTQPIWNLVSQSNVFLDSEY